MSASEPTVHSKFGHYVALITPGNQIHVPVHTRKIVLHQEQYHFRSDLVGTFRTNVLLPMAENIRIQLKFARRVIWFHGFMNIFQGHAVLLRLKFYFTRSTAWIVVRVHVLTVYTLPRKTLVHRRRYWSINKSNVIIIIIIIITKDCGLLHFQWGWSNNFT